MAQQERPLGGYGLLEGGGSGFGAVRRPRSQRVSLIWRDGFVKAFARESADGSEPSTSMRDRLLNTGSNLWTICW